MVDLIVKDYLACRDVRIGVRGLTVVRGESYSGKSSMFRGLVSAFTNRWSSRCVRWGCSCSIVSVSALMVLFFGLSRGIRLVLVTSWTVLFTIRLAATFRVVFRRFLASGVWTAVVIAFR